MNDRISDALDNTLAIGFVWIYIRNGIFPPLSSEQYSGYCNFDYEYTTIRPIEFIHR